MTPALHSEAIYEQEHEKAMMYIGNAEVTIKIFIFATILVCINLVAFV